jgi:hypothetical protein
MWSKPSLLKQLARPFFQEETIIKLHKYERWKEVWLQ